MSSPADLDQLEKFFGFLTESTPAGERNNALTAFMNYARKENIDVRDLRLSLTDKQQAAIDQTKAAEDAARLARYQNALRQAYPDQAAMADEIDRLKSELKIVKAEAKSSTKGPTKADLSARANAEKAEAARLKAEEKVELKAVKMQLSEMVTQIGSLKVDFTEKLNKTPLVKLMQQALNEAGQTSQRRKMEQEELHESLSRIYGVSLILNNALVDLGFPNGAPDPVPKWLAVAIRIKLAHLDDRNGTE